MANYDHSLDIRPKKNSKKLFDKFTYCYTYMPIYGSKFWNLGGQKIGQLFDSSEIYTFWPSKQPISDLFKSLYQGM